VTGYAYLFTREFIAEIIDGDGCGSDAGFPLRIRLRIAPLVLLLVLPAPRLVVLRRARPSGCRVGLGGRRARA
jgi:hypothetical protein